MVSTLPADRYRTSTNGGAYSWVYCLWVASWAIPLKAFDGGAVLLVTFFVGLAMAFAWLWWTNNRDWIDVSDNHMLVVTPFPWRHRVPFGQISDVRKVDFDEPVNLRDSFPGLWRRLPLRDVSSFRRRTLVPDYLTPPNVLVEFKEPTTPVSFPYRVTSSSC